MLGSDAREPVNRFIGQGANALPGLGPDRLLAECDIESEIVNVGHVQPPTADVPGRSNSASWTSPVKMPAAGAATLSVFIDKTRPASAPGSDAAFPRVT
jgi:hypothetical protein